MQRTCISARRVGEMLPLLDNLLLHFRLSLPREAGPSLPPDAVAAGPPLSWGLGDPPRDRDDGRREGLGVPELDLRTYIPYKGVNGTHFKKH